MTNPGMVAVAAGLLSLMCAWPAGSAAEKPDSGDRPTLSVTEVLQRWKVGTARLSARGRLRYRGTAQLDEMGWRKRPLHCHLDWDGAADFQVGMNESEVLDNRNPLRIPLWMSGLRRVSKSELLFVRFDDDSYASASRWTGSESGESIWDWLLPSQKLRRSQAAQAMAVSLAGPGWIGTPENWSDDWSWTVLNQDSHRVVLRGIPQGTDRSVFREVRWLIDRQQWIVVGVQWTDADNLGITNLDRVASPWPENLRRPLITTEELEQRGFRDVGNLVGKLPLASRPADALLPRNCWEW